MDDPNFWDKVAEKAELNIMDDIDENELLMLYEPRQRKQVRKFGPDGVTAQDAESDDDYEGGVKKVCLLLPRSRPMEQNFGLRPNAPDSSAVSCFTDTVAGIRCFHNSAVAQKRTWKLPQNW